jgi:hypothetical protein
MGKGVLDKAKTIALLAGAVLLGFTGYCWGTTAVLNSPPYTAETLSAHIYAARLTHQVIATDPVSGEIHLLIGYVYNNSEPFQLVDVNLTTGVANVVDAVPGAPNLTNAFALRPNGKHYIASNDPGYLYEYDLQTGVGRSIHALADKAGMCLTVGDDSKLYIGEAVKGYLERFDPDTGAWDNFGILDDPGPPYYRYAYTVGADDRYVYVAMGKLPWYLVVYDLETRSTQTFWKDLAPAMVTVSRGRAGGWYAYVSGLGWFALRHGQPVPITETPDVVPYTHRGGVCGDRTFETCDLPWEIDLGRAVPVGTGIEATAEISWREKEDRRPSPPTNLIVSGGESVVAPELDEVTSSEQHVQVGVRMSTQFVRRLVPGPGDGEVFGFTTSYGPAFRFTNSSELPFTVLGATQRSSYDALYLPEQDRWYLAGYPAALLEYDPNAPWTLLPGRDPSDPTLNPHEPVPGFGKYHYYLAKGSDGLVYVGVHQEREAVGGELGWFDPVARTKGSLRLPFERFDVRDLKAALGGQKLVYSSVSLDSEDAKLFVFDVASKKLEREITPLPGVSALDKVVETSPGVVVGVAGSTVFSVDIRDGRVLYRKDMGGQFGTVVSYDRRLILGPDGRVWLVLVPEGAGPHLARINPVDGSVELLQEVPGLVNFVLVRDASGSGYDALLYGYEEIRRLPDVLLDPQ